MRMDEEDRKGEAVRSGFAQPMPDEHHIHVSMQEKSSALPIETFETFIRLP
jgi:hypothetical protein